MTDHQPVPEARTTLTHADCVVSTPLGYRPLHLDLHVPAGDGPFPVLLWIHGGGWLTGSREWTVDPRFHERMTPFPWLDYHVVFARPLPYLLLLVALLRLTILSTSYLIPYYLGGVRGFRALQVGDTLIWIAAPQLIICLLAAFILRRSDPRILASVGLCLVGLACMSVAHRTRPPS